jgi:predicted RNA-binding Zn-ribbon protein involved in translation (DUF1610 family)
VDTNLYYQKQKKSSKEKLYHTKELNLYELSLIIGGQKFHEGHKCPRCGTMQFIIHSFRNNGTHVHMCPNCGTKWYHRNQ